MTALLVAAAMLCGGLGGCQNPGPGGGPASGPAGRPLFSRATGQERWTIRCLHSSATGHAQDCGQLAEMLKRVEGLRASEVRLVTDQGGSSIYYGQYVKTGSPQTGLLVFPPEYQHDIELIRRLSAGGRTPFFFAEPELLERGAPAAADDLDISHAKGDYTLQIAVFYNTATFSQREQAAVKYVRALRQEGYPAYCWHDRTRGISYVYVGDFERGDLITQDGLNRLGPRVEQFIARNEAEFRHISENGHLVKRQSVDGPMAAPLSYLVLVPRASGGAAVKPK